jgi:hypothetical protein
VENLLLLLEKETRHQLLRSKELQEQESQLQHRLQELYPILQQPQTERVVLTATPHLPELTLELPLPLQQEPPLRLQRTQK